MITWEFDIRCEAVKTLTLSGPVTEEMARRVLGLVLRGELGFGPFIKWAERGEARAIPVEVVDLKTAKIVAVRVFLTPAVPPLDLAASPAAETGEADAPAAQPASSQAT